jgi:hypothetical protein
MDGDGLSPAQRLKDAVDAAQAFFGRQLRYFVKELRDEWDDQGITPWTSDDVDRCIVGLLDGGVGIRPRIW